MPILAIISPLHILYYSIISKCPETRLFYALRGFTIFIHIQYIFSRKEILKMRYISYTLKSILIALFYIIKGFIFPVISLYHNFKTPFKIDFKPLWCYSLFYLFCSSYYFIDYYHSFCYMIIIIIIISNCINCIYIGGKSKYSNNQIILNYQFLPSRLGVY